MKKQLSIVTVVLYTAGTIMTSVPVMAEEQEIAVVNLQTEGLTNPIAINTTAPAFSWKMDSDKIGAEQKSYHIIVKNAEDQVVWDSGVVESSESISIPYEGEEISAASAYTWSVVITDQNGEEAESEIASFETSLLQDTKEAFEGADWIGADELEVDSTAVCVYEIDATLLIPEGSTKAAFILGANDFRTKSKVFNVEAVESEESYVKVEFDYSDVTADGGAKINFYRCGLYQEDDPAEVAFVIEESDDLNSVINASNANDPHDISIYVHGNQFTITVDDVTLEEVACVNKYGANENNTYPNLNSVGFAVEEGQKAIYTDYRIENSGKYGSGILFGENTGATYAIFDGFENTQIDGNVITVEGEMLAYADPEYGAEAMLRKDFELGEEIESARLYLTAQGIYNFYINGQELAPEEWFNPGSEEYDQIMAYTIYDVKDYLQSGANAMGAILGEGWWTGMMTFETSNCNYYGDQPALMAMLKVRYADGSEDTIITDESWGYFGEGPVRNASFFQGEIYDATKEAEVEGWTTADFDASAWKAAAIVETRSQFADMKFETRDDVPVHVIRVNDVVEALGETKEGSGSYIYDMGENVSGVPVITIPEEFAKEGETLTIRYAEILYPELEEYVSAGVDGCLMVENYRSALVTDFYTMKAGDQVFAPDLTFHGYRYIEITGLDKELPAECIQMKVLSSMDATAEYESSNELVNQLFKNIVNSTTSNYISIPTDCPQRDERLGWTGDAQVYALSGSYVANTYNFLREWMNTVRADCGESGMSAQFCPAFVQYDPESSDKIEHKGQSFGITWNSLVVSIPYNLYMQTGRKEIVEDNIENIYAYINTLNEKPYSFKNADGDKLEDDRLTGETGTLADHLARVTTDGPMLGNVLYYACLKEAAVMAEAVGDSEKAEEFLARAEVVKEAWNEVFVDPETGLTHNTKGEVQDTQASYATPLRFGIVSDENLEKFLENYRRSIEEPNENVKDGLPVVPYTITTGFNATGNVLNAFSMNGMNDLAYKLFESTEYASWLYPVTQGATSIWERWNSYTEENGFGGNNSMNSLNHYSLGAVYEWMIGYQLGIISGAEAGYKNFVLQPIAGGTFTDVKGAYESAYGTIRSGWTAEDGVMTEYDVTVPANTSATLYLPVAAESVEGCEGVTPVGATEHNGIETYEIQLAAGSYHFDIVDGSVTAVIA